MIKTTNRRIPVGVMLIAAFYLFGAAVLLVSMFTNPVEVGRAIADAHGMLPTTDVMILPIVAVLALLMAYGLLMLSRWGYFLTVLYAAIFGAISVSLMIPHFQQPYIGNATWSVLVVVYLVANRGAFLKTT